MEENSYIKRQRIYKTIMLVVLTAFITFVLTSLLITNKLQFNNTSSGSSITSIFQNLTGSNKIQDALDTIEKQIKEKYLNDYDEEAALDAAIEGALEAYVASLGDEYTEYIPADQMEDYTESIIGNFIGIGIYMTNNTEKNLIQVVSPIRESPAEEAGIKAGDFITKVDGVEYTGEQMSEAANIIKGKEGTSVTIEILRGNETLTFEIERRKINTNPVYEYLLEDNIGYLGVTSFDEGTAEDFKGKYLSLKEKGITSLIIDLRYNGGGIVDEALAIIDYLVPKGETVLITVDKNNNEEKTVAQEDVLIDVPVVVLVNEASASASEIMAGALKDLKIATIVGKKTFGKGVIQQFMALSNGGGLKVTIKEYYTPNKSKINEEGIAPDVEVELETSITGLPTDTNDTQLNRAKEILKSQ